MKCALTTNENCNEDEEISCCKPERPLLEGYRVLNEQIAIFKDEQGYEKPIEITDSDIEEAQFTENIPLEDEDGDVKIS